ncbi:MAG TPA: hypothetical protein VJZ68_01600 [Nitrososphaera sp.]|nr:hypothetical protein [Nitrososphaera sp.]
MEIIIEPWKKLVIHELTEYQFEDFLQFMGATARAAGGGIITMNWANGVTFQILSFPESEVIVEEFLKGIIHYSNVLFALKEKFEKQIRKEYGTFMMADMSANEHLVQLSSVLKENSKFNKS